ncbi:unnamed protein product [Anisakis simplex]|uniref:FI16517p1 (inferred by orthology to a D. melanogaster protein) n=1 Tax=Anisakis simplex TaxID=6269 RepID=A0A0M3KCA4_ANISI|nr:unnamed protein product [Anisakis simplex]
MRVFLNKQIYVAELDTRNDRYERIVKISRDITIESKRIIFQLHRCTTSDDKENILKNAAERLSNLRSKQFYAIAKELINLDQNMYNRAITFGLQEFIEAWSFYTFLKEGTLLRLDEIALGLKFDMPHEGGDVEKNEGERYYLSFILLVLYYLVYGVIFVLFLCLFYWTS